MNPVFLALLVAATVPLAVIVAYVVVRPQGPASERCMPCRKSC